MGDKPFTPRTCLLPAGEGSGDEGTERKAFIQGSVVVTLLCAAFAAPCSAGAWKWVDAQGVAQYSDTRPADRGARLVDTRPFGIEWDGARPCHTIWCQGWRLNEKNRKVAEQEAAQIKPSSRAAAADDTRGMDFDIFIRLRTGMSEGELLLRAGKPDSEAVENLRSDIVKSYYYFPTASNPWITTITLRGGRIVNIDRVKKIF